MASPNCTKTRLERLMVAKSDLETLIQTNGNILAANGNVGMHGDLVDSEGYPRNDIDVFQVRTARQAIICLQNDHKDLMNQIQTLLNQYHSEINTSDPELINRASALELNSDDERGSAGGMPENTCPLVVVNHISPGSPAEEAGLMLGDAILWFGSLRGGNTKDILAKIGEIVRNMQNQKVSLKVKRGEQFLDLVLTPKQWSGRGLLGCNIVLPP